MIQELLAGVHAEFRRLADPGVRISLDRFFKPDQRIPSYGIAAPEIKRVAQDAYRRVKS